MSRPQIDKESFRMMRLEVVWDCCWWCGRTQAEKPAGWGSPWLIERAHIVNNPRAEDRRACILLCSWCHKVQHGEQIVLPGCESLCRPEVKHMLWLKSKFDASYYDREFLSHFCIGVLPRAVAPRPEVLWAWEDRRAVRKFSEAAKH